MFILLTDAELGDQRTVAVDVLLLEVRQHGTALADHLEQAAAGVVVLLVDLEVLSELLNARGQDSDLDLRRTGVGRVGAVCLDNGSLVFLTDHDCFTFHINIVFGFSDPRAGLRLGEMDAVGTRPVFPPAKQGAKAQFMITRSHEFVKQFLFFCSFYRKRALFPVPFVELTNYEQIVNGILSDFHLVQTGDRML